MEPTAVDSAYIACQVKPISLNLKMSFSPYEALWNNLFKYQYALIIGNLILSRE